MKHPFPSSPLLSRYPTFGSLALGVLILTSASDSSRGETIANPIPEKIPSSRTTVRLQPVAQGLASPLLVVHGTDKSGRLFVVDQIGKVYVIRDGGLEENSFLDVSDLLVPLNKDFDERGLLGLALDPGFADPKSPGKGRIFTYTSEPLKAPAGTPDAKGSGVPPDHQSVIASWRVSGANPGVIDRKTREELLRIDQPQFNHNGGMIAFGPDGFLYIGLGDGGAANDLGAGHNPEIGNGQDKGVLLGKMLRIDVNSSNSGKGPYGIPKDNPFAAGGGAAEIFAIGLRNPFRFSFDRETLLVGDVGQNKMEMVYIVERGGNYGWRIKEGTFKFNIDGSIEQPTGALPKGLTDPVLQYDRDEGTSVMGGHVYRGKAFPELVGKYIFGDYREGSSGTGRLFVGDLQTRRIEELGVGSVGGRPGFLIKGFGVDPEGELYVVGSAEAGPSGTGGVVMKMVPAQP